MPEVDYTNLDLIERSKMDLKILQVKLDEYDEYIREMFLKRDKKISMMNKEISRLANLISQMDEEIKKVQDELEYFKKL